MIEIREHILVVEEDVFDSLEAAAEFLETADCAAYEEAAGYFKTLLNSLYWNTATVLIYERKFMDGMYAEGRG